MDRREGPQFENPLCSENDEREWPFVYVDTVERVRYACDRTLDAVQE